MGTTPKIYTPAQIQRGAADLWWNVAKPASGNHVITLASDGTPDAVANPSARHLGLVDSASVFSYGPKYDLEKTDQDTAPVVAFLTEEEADIEATMKQLTFTNVMQYCMPAGLFSDGSKEGVTLGQGNNIVVQPAPLAIIAPSADPNYKWVVALLYQAFPASGVKLEMTRAKTAAYQIKFSGLSDLTRPNGDRIGSLYRTK